MATLTQEEENYIRIALLLTGVSPRGVRILFDREFAPVCLQATINKEFTKLNALKTKRILNQTQWDLLHPRSGSADSKTFDVILMITLIRNLTTLPHPAMGFDRLPSSMETTPCADLARIKYYRNFIAHIDQNMVDNSTFNSAWNEISDALRRLGGHALFLECQELKIKILDQSNQEIMLEIKHSQDEINTLKQSMKSLKESYEDLQSEYQDMTKEIEKLKLSQTDPVPRNIRERIKSTIQDWKKSGEKFVETRASKYILKCIKCKSCVTVTGNSGVGKTVTVRHVALLMAGEGYYILPVTDPSDIVKFYNPNQKTLYVIDDLCGLYTLNQNSFDRWSEQLPLVNPLLKHIKIIVSCRLQVYRDAQFEILELFKSCECNLLSQEWCLSDTEKDSIAKMYLKTNASKIKPYSDKFDFFPLLCHLCHENPSLDVVDFFQNPFSVYESELNKLKTGAYTKYCCLALCVMFNNRLKEKWLTEEVSKSIDIVIQNTCEVCKLNRCTSKYLLRDELDSLLHTFLKKENNIYSTLHDKLFDFLSYYFGKMMITCLIKNANCRFIRERFLFDSEFGSDKFITIVPKIYKEMYIKRMIDDWTKGEVVNVFSNINMKVPTFRQMLLSSTKKLDISRQTQLAHTLDTGMNKESVLSVLCSIGYIDFIDWCLSHNVDVNQCRLDGVSPLNMACQQGYIDIVTLLLTNRADTNKCSNNDQSPLCTACYNGHIDIVKLLLTNKADINKCNKAGLSPLYGACQKGHIDIVTLLLTNKAPINKYRNDGVSPLCKACELGNIDIVKLLLTNKADINKYANDGESPLFFACQNGHIHIVELLLTNKVDINKCSNDGVSPLYVACQNGHIDIVTLLLTNKADINKCRNDGASPLYISCVQGHIDIVKLLLTNKADITKCKNDEVSPLLMACQNGHVHIVTLLLLTNKTDINKCTNDGLSPLFFACENGHIHIVELLLKNKADINKCSNDGVPPLYIACQNGHIDIVTLLIKNKADIHKCNNDGVTPLHIASQIGYFDIVQLLLKNKPDINKCSNDGKSPLYIACQNGHTNIVSLLLTNKADINKCCNNGVTPLLLACKSGYIDIVKMLLTNKADINRCRNDGLSPLLSACYGAHIEIVKLLLSNEGDILMLGRHPTPPYVIQERLRKQ